MFKIAIDVVAAVTTMLGREGSSSWWLDKRKAQSCQGRQVRNRLITLWSYHESDR
jgi:hypothetical protein